MTTRSSFRTTLSAPLDRTSPPLRLFEKSKRLGIWNPSDIDLSGDREAWLSLSDLERDAILRLTSLFATGEESVALELVPLVGAVAREGRLDEEIFLASFLFEEAKHVDFFCRFLDQVVGDYPDLSRYHTESYRTLFYDALPRAMEALAALSSPTTQAVASVTYNMVVEGVLAETGYYAYFTVLEERGVMLGLAQGLSNIRRDESRHIAYGVYLLSRLVAEAPEVWSVIEEKMNELLPLPLGIITEIFAAYDTMPFGLVLDPFLEFATRQFTRRFERIRRSRELTLEEVRAAATDDEE